MFCISLLIPFQNPLEGFICLLSGSNNPHFVAKWPQMYPRHTFVICTLKCDSHTLSSKNPRGELDQVKPLTPVCNNV